MSGSTLTKVVFMVVIGGGLITLLVIILKLAFGKKDTDSTDNTDASL